MNEIGTQTQSVSQTKEITLISGLTVTIREQNGADEDILTRGANNKDNTALAKYISSILVTPHLTPEEVMKWKLGDKYSCIIQARIFNFGEEMEFTHTYPDGQSQMLNINLSEYLVGYVDEKGNKGKYTPEVHPGGSDEIGSVDISDGQLYEFTYSNSYSEKYVINKGVENLSVNDVLLSRDFKVNGKEVMNFRKFSSRTMSKLRRAVVEKDPDFVPLVDIPPLGNNPADVLPLHIITEFFFPD